MTITLTNKESQELWDESIQNSRHNYPSAELDFYSHLPRQLGKGQIQGWVEERNPTFIWALGLPCGKAAPTQSLNPTLYLRNSSRPSQPWSS
ncbi:MAG: hypothetical protein V7L27_23540 [Nostoc sp.]|uniref:hypothetical protein n=1 Tax=Nostoc sp. TaxID=1180 RepID=UPI002FFA8A88